MIRLEEEMWSAIMRVEDNQEDENFFDIDSYAKAAAEVAKKYIEGAMESCAHFVAMQQSGKHGNWPQIKEKWLKDNGITE